MKKKITLIVFLFLFSIVLWCSVSLSGDYISTVKIPIQVIDLPNHYSVGHISNKEIFLRLKAKGWELAKINLRSDVEYFVSAHHKIGKSRIDLINDIENNPWLSSSFQVVEISPSFIEFDIDKNISKKVKVRPNIKLELKEGYGLASDLIVTPEVIGISGPASLLQNIDTIKTRYLELLSVSENMSVDIPIEEIEGVTLAENTSKIEFDVQKIVNKSFDNLEVELRNVPSSKELLLYPSKISVVLQGGINKLGKLTNDSIKAYIDYWSVLRTNEETIEPVIQIPSFTTLIDVIPKKLEYIIKQY